MNDFVDIRDNFINLTEFLGHVLGSDYEIVFHDLTDPAHSIKAIANGHISGRKIGAPLTNVALSVIKDESYKEKDYRADDKGISASGHELRSNTFYIKSEDQLIGMLCINFDDSRYRAAAEQIMNLTRGIPNLSAETENNENTTVITENYGASPEVVTADAINHEIEKLGVSADRLTQEEKMKIIAALDNQGIFLFKGVVKDVALALHCSQASVYRYMSQLKINGVI